MLFKMFASVQGLAVLCVFVVPAATADDWNRKTVITFSGHGGMHVPATGKILADLILHGATELIDAKLLDLARFAEGRAIHETAVL